MGLKEKVIDIIQKQGGKVAQEVLDELKIKSFGSINIELGELVITPPTIKITANNFKLKVIDKSNGNAITDIPIPINSEIKIAPIRIALSNIEIKPEIDVMLGGKK